MTWIVRGVAACLISLCAASAMAADPAAPSQSGAFFLHLDGIAGFLERKLSGMNAISEGFLAQGRMVAGQLTNVALSLGGILALLYLFAEAIKSLAGRGDSPLHIFGDIALPVVLVVALIQGYDAHLENLRSFFTSVLTQIGENPIGGIVKYFGSALAMIGTAFKAAISSVPGISLSWDFVLPLLDVLVVFLFLLPVLFIIIISLAELVAVLLLGPFLFAVGAAFGPLFIATLVTPWTRPYFNKWLGFMVGAWMVSAVASVAISIASTIFATMNFDTTTSGVPVAVSLAIGTIMLVSVNAVLGQIPHIATALVPGSIGVTQSGGQRIPGSAKSAMSTIKGYGSTATLAMGGARGALARINGSSTTKTSPSIALPLPTPAPVGPRGTP